MHKIVFLAGLLISVLVGCVPSNNPESVAKAFVSSLAGNDMDEALGYADSARIRDLRHEAAVWINLLWNNKRKYEGIVGKTIKTTKDGGYARMITQGSCL